MPSSCKGSNSAVRTVPVGRLVVELEREGRRRVHEHLVVDVESALVAREERDRRREVATRAVTADDEPVGTAQHLRPVGRPLDDPVAVQQTRRELVFRSEAVVRCDHDAVEFVREYPADGVVGLHVAQQEAPAVHPDEDRKRPVALRRVHADRYVSVRSLNDAVAHVFERREFALDGEEVGVPFARLFDRERVQGRHFGNYRFDVGLWF
jgi:hypothetical protein